MSQFVISKDEEDILRSQSVASKKEKDSLRSQNASLKPRRPIGFIQPKDEED